MDMDHFLLDSGPFLLDPDPFLMDPQQRLSIYTDSDPSLVLDYDPTVHSQLLQTILHEMTKLGRSVHDVL